MIRSPRIVLEVRALRAVVRSGMLGLDSPRTMRAMIAALRAYGAFGSASRIAALRHGDLPAVVDDRGELTFAELDDRVNRLANVLRAKGIHADSSVGVLCGNHRQLLIVCFAVTRAGLNLVLLNTAFSPRQAAEVTEREHVDLLIHDRELADVVTGVNAPLGTFVADIENPAADELDGLIGRGSPTLPPTPARPGRLIILTSGTTGTPKGAPRPDPRGFVTAGSVLQRMPMRARESTVVGPPLFHGTGLLVALLSIGLGSRLVLRRRFDPGQFLDDIERHRATSVCVVPIMLQRVLALGEEAIRQRDLSSVRVVFSAGSPLPADVAGRTTAVFGDVIYNLYGSTEVALATMTTPEDVREAPTSVGRPLLGSRVRILDDAGNAVPQGETGRIFVGTLMPFEGYTGGGGKEVIDGLLSTGDVGHVDQNGRLYIDGRDDEMIVSGGENVFPREVEELLLTHPALADAAAIGVADEEFGQRLRVFAVVVDGQRLDAQEVQAFVRENLARYKVPRDVVFLAELPRNPTGKVLKRELVLVAASAGVS